MTFVRHTPGPPRRTHDQNSNQFTFMRVVCVMTSEGLTLKQKTVMAASAFGCSLDENQDCSAQFTRSSRNVAFE